MKPDEVFCCEESCALCSSTASAAPQTRAREETQGDQGTLAEGQEKAGKVYVSVSSELHLKTPARMCLHTFTSMRCAGL